MPLDVATSIFGLKRLEPLQDARDSETIIVNLAPNQTLAMGTVLGQVTSNAADVQTLTITGTPTGGSVTITGTNPITKATYTVVIPFNATSSAAQVLVNAAVGSGNLTVGGGTLPGTALTLTAAGNFANMPLILSTVTTNALTGGSSPAGAVTHTTTGRSANTAAAYNSALAAVPPVPVVTGTGSGSGWAAGTHNVTVTGVNAQGETTASLNAKVTLTAAQLINVAALTGLDTSFTVLNVYVDGEQVGTCAVAAGTSTATTFDAALEATTGQPPPRTNTAYTVPNGAGTQTARWLLPWDIATDATGVITFGAQTGGGEFDQGYRNMPVYAKGYFATVDLTGLDAKAVSDLGKLVGGSITAGTLRVN